MYIAMLLVEKEVHSVLVVRVLPMFGARSYLHQEGRCWVRCC